MMQFQMVGEHRGLKGAGGDQLQPRVEDGGTHTEFVARVENLAGKYGKKKAVST